MNLMQDNKHRTFYSNLIKASMIISHSNSPYKTAQTIRICLNQSLCIMKKIVRKLQK